VADGPVVVAIAADSRTKTTGSPRASRANRAGEPTVERFAETIGADIAQEEQQQIQTAVQLDLPIPSARRFPLCANGRNGRPRRRRDSWVDEVRSRASPRTRERLSWAAYSRKAPGKRKATRSATGAIESAEEFGKRIYREALKRGWRCAKKKVVIGDGAEWIWTLVAEHFPEAMQIVDLYHARQHLWEVARQLYPHEKNKQNAWMQVHQKSAGPGKNRKIGGRAAGHAHQQCRSGREDSPGGRLQSGLLRDEEGSCVITHLKRRVRVYDSTFQITETRAKRRASRRPKMSVRSGGAKLVRIALSEGVSGSQTNGP
jgi:hypothetical protein